MTITMYDAGFGNAHLIPRDAKAVAGHGFDQALWDLWPHAARVTIAHSAADYGANVADFEPGGQWIWGPNNLRTWLRGHQRQTGDPGAVYVNHKWIWLVSLAARGLGPPWIWASDQTGRPHMVRGPRVVATQWYGSRQRGWHGVDISQVADLGALTGTGGGTTASAPARRSWRKPRGAVQTGTDSSGGSIVTTGQPVMTAPPAAAGGGSQWGVVLLAAVLVVAAWLAYEAWKAKG